MDKSNTDLTEPYNFIYKSVINLSRTLGLVGQILANTDYVDQEDISQFKEALTNSATIVYLIEEADDQEAFVEKIKRIHTQYLVYTLNNIYNYGTQFNKDQAIIEQEISEFKEDNSDYFNEEGQLKYVIYQPTLEEAISYLVNNSGITLVKLASKQLKITHSYFLDLNSNTAKQTVDYSKDNLFISHILNGITFIFLALSYLEPFFEKPKAVVAVFETSVNEIMASQSAILNTL